jgi:hypothetical protein
MAKLLHAQDAEELNPSDLDGGKSLLNSNSRFYSPNSSIKTLTTLNTLDENYLASLPSYMVDGSFGVDMVRISLVVDPNSVVHADFLSNVYGSDGNKTNGTVKLPGQPNVYMFWPDTGRQIMTLQFNPSNFSRAHGLEICPPVLLGHFIKHVIQQVLALGDPQARPDFMASAPWGAVEPWPQNWYEFVYLSNIHFARDMVISDPRFDLRQLELLKPKRMGAVKLILGSDGSVETVTHTAGKDTAKHQIYDKHKERQKLLASKKKTKVVTDPIPKGTFRYEVQMPRVALRKIHIKTLDVMTPERIQKMALGYWANSNYGSPLIWAGQVAAEMGTVMSFTETAEAIHYINNLQLGVPINLPRKEQKRIEGLIKSSGFSIKKPLCQQGLPYGSLDFKTGSLSLIP